ncbi:MAG: hypothetical protein NTW19_04300 [Planctomycetota bacterium]|nr:hypothetical protein [Planctomycetota bacterium]
MSTPADIDAWLAAFALDGVLHDHARQVVEALPQEVRLDLMLDARFLIADYESGPGRGMQVPVGQPSRHSVSRSVVFKRSLRRNHPEFVRYVIAHELAHAFLRNAGRSPEEDPEQAADALAAQWGFPRTAWR